VALLMELMKMNIAFVGRMDVDRFDVEADEAEFDAAFPTRAPGTLHNGRRFFGFESGHGSSPILVEVIPPMDPK